MKLRMFACAMCALVLFGCGAKEETVQTTTSSVTEQATTAVSSESAVVSATDDVTDTVATTETTDAETTTAMGTTTTTSGTTTSVVQTTAVTTVQKTTTLTTTTVPKEAVTTTTVRTKKTKFPIKTSSVVALTEILVEPSDVVLLVGETKTLKATVKPQNTTERIVWSSSDPSVAAVAEDGTVTAVALGETVITVTGEGSVSAACRVKVREVALDLPVLPTEVRYNADYSKTVAICLQMTDVDTQYTANQELVMTFDGWLSYSTDGKGFYTTPEFGWRVFDGDSVLAEGVCFGKEAACVGMPIGKVTATIPDVAPGRYRLEFYSTYRK